MSLKLSTMQAELVSSVAKLHLPGGPCSSSARKPGSPPPLCPVHPISHQMLVFFASLSVVPPARKSFPMPWCGSSSAPSIPPATSREARPKGIFLRPGTDQTWGSLGGAKPAVAAGARASLHSPGSMWGGGGQWGGGQSRAHNH